MHQDCKSVEIFLFTSIFVVKEECKNFIQPKNSVFPLLIGIRSQKSLLYVTLNITKPIFFRKLEHSAIYLK